MTVEQQFPPPQRTSGYAIASLVLGIAGFVVCPLIPSILAIIFASKAQDEIRTSPNVGGDGFATAGKVLGWIGVGLVLLAIALFVLLLALGVAFGDEGGDESEVVFSLLRLL